MPDSWIDKEELDELVGRFAVGRKARRRKPSGNAGVSRPERAVEEVGVIEEVGAAWPATIFELDLGDEDEDEAVPLEVETAELPCGDEPETEEAVVFGEEEVEPSTPAIIVELPEAETLEREVPEFLDDSDDFLHPRGGSMLERDADRALVALADARAKADKSQLLRLIGSVAGNAEADTDPATDEGEEPEVEEGSVPPSVETPEPELESELEPEAADSIEDRICRFGSWLRDRLGGTEIAVCDANGLLLYSDMVDGVTDGLDTALLLDASGRTNRLLGIENPGMVQVSLDGGAWRCLLRGDTGRGPVYAGFKLRRPLERDEGEYWSLALVEALGPI